MKCYICKKDIDEHATTIGTNGWVAHFDCAQKSPLAFAKMMTTKKKAAQ